MFNFIASTIQRTGAMGVFMLMLLENIIPIVPSELIMPMVGFESARGALNLFWAVAAGTVGSIVGGTAWYWAGRRFGLNGLERLARRGGRWLPIVPSEVRQAQMWFDRFGVAAVCIGRTLPGVRGVICIPAGIAHMPFGLFMIWSSVGAFIWTLLLTFSGYVLQSHFDQLGKWLNPVSSAFLIVCLAAYAVRVICYRKPGSTDH